MSSAPQNTPFFAGIAVGLAFRAFSYFLLITAPSWFDWHRLPPIPVAVLPVIYWTMAFFSPFWVPFVGGFLSAYFWRCLPTQDYLVATRIGMIAVAIALLLASCVLQLLPLFMLGVLLVYIDAGMSASGMEHGAWFWNGRLGRQFMGDFSTRDPDVLTHDSDF